MSGQERTHEATREPAPPAAHVNLKPHPLPARTVTAQSSVPQASISQDIQNWATEWYPVIGIVFFVSLVFLMWRTLKVMPRIKPQRIKPASDQSVTFADIAGVDEAKAELQEIVE